MHSFVCINEPFAPLVVSSLLPRYVATCNLYIRRYVQMVLIFVMVFKSFLSIGFISQASDDLPVVFKELFAKCLTHHYKQYVLSHFGYKLQRGLVSIFYKN
jgi:hypothetical protein